MRQNIVTVLKSISDKYPRKIFLIFGKKKMTFRYIEEISSSLAAYFISKGIGKGQRVALWIGNTPEFVISYFAVLKSGATVVPVNTMLKREEAKFIMEDSSVRAVVCSNSRIEDSLNIASRIHPLEIIISSSFPKHIYYQVGDLYDLAKNNAGEYSYPGIEENSLAAILYTSGTTGRPKGACLSHSNFISNIKDCAKLMKLKPSDRFICVLPLFHSFAFTVCLLLPLYKGASVVLFRAVRPFKRIIRSLRNNRVTVFVGVPSIYNILKDIRTPWFLRSFILRAVFPVRACICGAAALNGKVKEIFEKKFGIPLLEGYGLTEASPVCSLNPLFGMRKTGSIGLPLPSVEMKIVDKNNSVLPAGSSGELIVKGPNIMAGYFNRPLDTKETLRDGWLYTGDMAKMDTEGYFYIVGRKKEMINVRGLNVYPREIEDVLYSHPDIKEAAVVGVIHPRKGEVPIAFVALNSGVKNNTARKKIMLFLKERIASYKMPFQLIVKDYLPKGATGKIQKFKLREDYAK